MYALLIEISGPICLGYNLYLTECLERRSQKAEWKHKQRKIKKDWKRRRESGRYTRVGWGCKAAPPGSGVQRSRAAGWEGAEYVEQQGGRNN